MVDAVNKEDEEAGREDIWKAIGAAGRADAVSKVELVGKRRSRRYLSRHQMCALNKIFRSVREGRIVQMTNLLYTIFNFYRD